MFMGRGYLKRCACGPLEKITEGVEQLEARKGRKILGTSILFCIGVFVALFAPPPTSLGKFIEMKANHLYWQLSVPECIDLSTGWLCYSILWDHRHCSLLILPKHVPEHYPTQGGIGTPQERSEVHGMWSNEILPSTAYKNGGGAFTNDCPKKSKDRLVLFFCCCKSKFPQTHERDIVQNIFFILRYYNNLKGTSNLFTNGSLSCESCTNNPPCGKVTDPVSHYLSGHCLQAFHCNVYCIHDQLRTKCAWTFMFEH